MMLSETLAACSLAGVLFAAVGMLFEGGLAAAPSRDWSPFWVSAPTLVSAVGAVVLGLMNALKLNRNNAVTDHIAIKTAEISDKVIVQGQDTAQIKEQGNHRWDEQQRELREARGEIKALQIMLAQMLPTAQAAGVAAAEMKVVEIESSGGTIGSARPGESTH